MRKKIVLFAIMLFLTLSYGSVTIAKEKATSRSKLTESSKEKKDNSPIVSFEIKTEKLPPNFKGTDIVKLFSIFEKKAPLIKEEFETTADYEKKIMAAVTDDVYAFKLDPTVGGMHGLTIHPYNADTQKLQIDVKTTSLSKYTFEDYRASVIIKDIAGVSGSHVGYNAFGAKVLVKTYFHTQYGIVLVNQKDFGTSSYDDNRYNIRTPLESDRTINLEIEVPSDKAKTLKNNIGVLLLCKPRLYKSNAKMKLNPGNDLILKDTYYSGATIDSPTSLLYDRYFINVEVLAIWVYEINTGSIILKKELKNKEEQQGTQM